MIKPILKIYTNTLAYQRHGIGPVEKFVKDITKEAIGWRRSTRSMGGCWAGSFSLTMELSDVFHIFDHWLGYNLREYSHGMWSWDGQIVEMDLTYKGMIRRRSLNLMRNYIKVSYLDEDGESQMTAAGEETFSTGKFGRYEALITADGLDSTAAEKYRDTQLNRWGWPRNTIIGADVGDISDENLAKLYVTVAGYIHTANRKFQTVGDGTLDNVSDWIEEILSDNCEFLYPGIIDSNTLQVYKTTSQPRRCWDLLKSLAEIGDADNDQYRIYCNPGGSVNYKQIDTTPQYVIRDGKLTYLGKMSVDIYPWLVQPAVMRDDTSPGAVIGWADPWLKTARAFYASEIDVGVDTGITVKTEYLDEGELLIARLNYLSQQDIGGE